MIDRCLTNFNNKNTKITIEGIPTYKCKLPYTSEWVLLGDLRYCLCLGDESKVEINHKYKLRFDSTSVVIQIVTEDGESVKITNDGGRKLITTTTTNNNKI